MSGWQHKEGSGTLFRNAKKEKESQPDMRGDILIGGTMSELAAWLKEGKNGKFTAWLVMSLIKRYYATK